MSRLEAELALVDAIHDNRLITMSAGTSLREIAGTLAYMGAVGPAADLRAIATMIEDAGKRVVDAQGSASVAELREHEASMQRIFTALLERLPS